MKRIEDEARNQLISRSRLGQMGARISRATTIIRALSTAAKKKNHWISNPQFPAPALCNYHHFNLLVFFGAFLHSPHIPSV